jgi:plasmid replication initiation protein
MKNSNVVKKQGLVLKTPQSLIHIKHRISLLQYKVWILLLHELKHQFNNEELADELGFRYIPMQHIVDKLGYAPKKLDIWQDLLALKNETIAFNLLEKDGQSAKYGAGFISEWTVSTNRIGFKFPSILESVMRGLDDAEAIFHKLNWEIFNHFSGKYEAIIYKLCKDYLGVGRTPYITIADFREYMGIGSEEYPDFKKLNVRVISEPISRINDSPVSDISVVVEFHRKGRKVEGLYFTMVSKSKIAIPLVAGENNPAFALAKVTIQQCDQQEYLSKMTPAQILASLERANEYGEELEKKGKKVNYGAIYKKAICENWVGQQVDHLNVKSSEGGSQLMIAASELKSSIKNIVVAEDTKDESQIADIFTALSDFEKKNLIENYLATLKGLAKAQMTAEYAGLKLLVVQQSLFKVGFFRYLAKLWVVQK